MLPEGPERLLNPQGLWEGPPFTQAINNSNENSSNSFWHFTINEALSYPPSYSILTVAL